MQPYSQTQNPLNTTISYTMHTQAQGLLNQASQPNTLIKVPQAVASSSADSTKEGPLVVDKWEDLDERSRWNKPAQAMNSNSQPQLGPSVATQMQFANISQLAQSAPLSIPPFGTGQMTLGPNALTMQASQASQFAMGLMTQMQNIPPLQQNPALFGLGFPSALAQVQAHNGFPQSQLINMTASQANSQNASLPMMIAQMQPQAQGPLLTYQQTQMLIPGNTQALGGPAPMLPQQFTQAPPQNGLPQFDLIHQQMIPQLGNLSFQPTASAAGALPLQTPSLAVNPLTNVGIATSIPLPIGLAQGQINTNTLMQQPVQGLILNNMSGQSFPQTPSVPFSRTLQNNVNLAQHPQQFMQNYQAQNLNNSQGPSMAFKLGMGPSPMGSATPVSSAPAPASALTTQKINMGALPAQIAQQNIPQSPPQFQGVAPSTPTGNPPASIILGPQSQQGVLNVSLGPNMAGPLLGSAGGPIPPGSLLPTPQAHENEQGRSPQIKPTPPQPLLPTPFSAPAANVSHLGGQHGEAHQRFPYVAKKQVREKDEFDHKNFRNISDRSNQWHQSQRNNNSGDKDYGNFNADAYKTSSDAANSNTTPSFTFSANLEPQSFISQKLDSKLKPSHDVEKSQIHFGFQSTDGSGRGLMGPGRKVGPGTGQMNAPIGSSTGAFSAYGSSFPTRSGPPHYQNPDKGPILVHPGQSNLQSSTDNSQRIPRLAKQKEQQQVQALMTAPTHAPSTSAQYSLPNQGNKGFYQKGIRGNAPTNVTPLGIKMQAQMPDGPKPLLSPAALASVTKPKHEQQLQQHQQQQQNLGPVKSLLELKPTDWPLVNQVTENPVPLRAGGTKVQGVRQAGNLDPQTNVPNFESESEFPALPVPQVQSPAQDSERPVIRILRRGGQTRDLASASVAPSSEANGHAGSTDSEAEPNVPSAGFEVGSVLALEPEVQVGQVISETREDRQKKYDETRQRIFGQTSRPELQAQKELELGEQSLSSISFGLGTPLQFGLGYLEPNAPGMLGIAELVPPVVAPFDVASGKTTNPIRVLRKGEAALGAPGEPEADSGSGSSASAPDAAEALGSDLGRVLDSEAEPH